MSETFTFDVAYDTTFEQLEELRGKMIAFLQKERRDFLPSFDLAVVGRYRRCFDRASCLTLCR
jgi:small-conductance mechanosensitive channel